MPGPNSARNGDTSIIIGHRDEEFIEETRTIDGDKVKVWVSKRLFLARKGRLTTGKTAWK